LAFQVLVVSWSLLWSYSPLAFSPSNLHLLSHPRSSLTTLASALHPLATLGRSGIGKNETIFKTTTSGKRPINGPWEVRVMGFEGLRTLKRDGVDGWPGLLGASGTHLFMFILPDYVCDRYSKSKMWNGVDKVSDTRPTCAYSRPPLHQTWKLCMRRQIHEFMHSIFCLGVAKCRQQTGNMRCSVHEYLVPSTAGPVDNAQDCLFALVDGRFIY